MITADCFESFFSHVYCFQCSIQTTFSNETYEDWKGWEDKCYLFGVFWYEPASLINCSHKSKLTSHHSKSTATYVDLINTWFHTWLFPQSDMLSCFLHCFSFYSPWIRVRPEEMSWNHFLLTNEKSFQMLIKVLTMLNQNRLLSAMEVVHIFFIIFTS